MDRTPMNMQSLPSQTEIEAALGLDRRSRRRKWLGRTVWIVLGLAMLAGASWWYAVSSGNGNTISYDTAPVARQTIVVKVQATGNVQPTTEVDVSSERSGVIRTVNVDANSIVRKGDVLAELDAERLEAQLTRLEAALAAAEARLADAKATGAEKQVALARAERLSRQGISAAQDLDTARASGARAAAAVLAAEADIDVAKADIVMQRTDIEKTRILSPVNGIVLKRSAEPGQTVASSFQAPVLFTLAEDLTRMQLEANVDEADIGQVKTEQKAAFTVDAYPGQSFPAVIDTIEYSPKVTDNVVTYKAVLTVDNSGMLLRPGMTATAQIVTQEVRDALAVPNAALRYAPPRVEKQQGWSVTNLFIPRMPRGERQTAPAANGERTLYVLENGAPKRVTVKTGVTDGRMTEIVSGDLAEGAEVITASKQAAN
jgi:HlyD family secretion protein